MIRVDGRMVEFLYVEIVKKIVFIVDVILEFDVVNG